MYRPESVWSGRRARRLGSVIGCEVFGHGIDLVAGPQRTASDHAIERGFPGAAVLALVAEHRVGVALEALRSEQRLARGLRRLGRLVGVRRRGLVLSERDTGAKRERKNRNALVHQRPLRPRMASISSMMPFMRATSAR